MGEPAYKRALREVQVPYTIDRETGMQKPAFDRVDVDEQDRKEREARKIALQTTMVNIPVSANLELATKILNAITAAHKKGINLSVPEDLQLLLSVLGIKPATEAKPEVKKTVKKTVKKNKKSKTATNG